MDQSNAGSRSPSSPTPGNVADITLAIPLFGAVAPPKRLLADKARDADSLRNRLAFRFKPGLARAVEVHYCFAASSACFLRSGPNWRLVSILGKTWTRDLIRQPFAVFT